MMDCPFLFGTYSDRVVAASPDVEVAIATAILELGLPLSAHGRLYPSLNDETFYLMTGAFLSEL